MKFDLFKRAVLRNNFPQYGLQQGDVGIVVEHIVRVNQKGGYIVEFFDVQSNTIDVLPVMESDLEAPHTNTILTYREMHRAA